MRLSNLQRRILEIGLDHGTVPPVHALVEKLYGLRLGGEWHSRDLKTGNHFTYGAMKLANHEDGFSRQPVGDHHYWFVPTDIETRRQHAAANAAVSRALSRLRALGLVEGIYTEPEHVSIEQSTAGFYMIRDAIAFMPGVSDESKLEQLAKLDAHAPHAYTIPPRWTGERVSEAGRNAIAEVVSASLPQPIANQADTTVTTRCACGAALDGERNTRRYCSPACRQRAYRARRATS